MSNAGDIQDEFLQRLVALGWIQAMVRRDVSATGSTAKVVWTPLGRDAMIQLDTVFALIEGGPHRLSSLQLAMLREMAHAAATGPKPPDDPHKRL